MAQTYTQIQRQIEMLQRKADALKASEVAGVVERIKVAISHYELTAEQLGFGGGKPSASKSKPSTKKAGGTTRDLGAAAYADDNGNTWGGRGPRPRWLRDAIAGKKLEDYATSAKPASTKAAKARPTLAKGKRKAKQSYEDQAGNVWSGFGPKPRWLNEALAAGATLEQFAA